MPSGESEAAQPAPPLPELGEDTVTYDTGTPKLSFEVDGPVAVVAICRPEVRNALDNETADALTAALRTFDADDALRVCVLTGSGGSFCAGADLKALSAGQDYRPWAGDPDGPCHDVLSKPVIAAVAGFACAGGLGLALRCDLRVAEETATFAVLSRRWGVPMSDGTTVRLPRLVGAGRALDMLLTARKVTGAEALAMGLADRLVPEGQALPAAMALAQEIAAFPQIALRSDRLSTLRQWDLSLPEAFAQEMELAAEARRVEARSGAARFAAGAGRHGAKADA
ncbi:MAG: crotonase/enoyl-CoA hydratase family protein [Alphaproteobacteria bacterium]|nr:crotonase/enoyl-CoA hydratase family protein [Alphaproteobacteria bacterium]MCB9931779.1 crotonase/enoyl-CoA hydratase family protein [Alphaproteobacteria bacterium]